jgi:HTH-type transcriptional regulator/antitoxin PezA
MNNFISENIAFLVKKHDLAIDDFGNLFDLTRGVTGQYIRKSSLPKIITIQKICEYYKLSIDDFINKDLSAIKPYAIKEGNLLYAAEQNEPYMISPRYVELLEKSIQDKDKIIKSLEEKLQGEDKSETA